MSCALSWSFILIICLGVEGIAIESGDSPTWRRRARGRYRNRRVADGRRNHRGASACAGAAARCGFGSAAAGSARRAASGHHASSAADEPHRCFPARDSNIAASLRCNLSGWLGFHGETSQWCLASPIFLHKACSRRFSGNQEDAVIYKGVEYTVVPTAEPDIWEWRFEVGDKVKTGRTQTRLVALAARRVQSKIDAELRAKSALVDKKS